MQKEHSLDGAETAYIHLFGYGVKSEIYYVENSVDPDWLASVEASQSGSTLFSIEHIIS